MRPQENNMVVLGQIVKHIPKKLIEKLKNKYKIQTRSFSATSHVVAMLFAQLSHALSLNDIQDCLRFHKGYLAQIRDCTPIRPGEIVVFDKAYVDFAHLWHLDQRGVTWITRSKENLCFEVMGQQLSEEEIQQTLQLADFLGTSENAIKWQIWTALPAYQLLRFIGWLNEWKESFRRLYSLIKGLLWSRRTISEILKLILGEDKSRPLPVKWTAVQLQFDFGDAFAQN